MIVFLEARHNSSITVYWISQNNLLVTFFIKKHINAQKHSRGIGVALDPICKFCMKAFFILSFLTSVYEIYDSNGCLLFSVANPAGSKNDHLVYFMPWLVPLIFTSILILLCVLIYYSVLRRRKYGNV